MTTGDGTPVPDYLARLTLAGKRAVVLGAGQGIGRQAVHALVQAGASVVAVDVDAGRAADVAAEAGALPATGDVTRRDEMERLFGEAAASLGGIDTVVDIVGIARFVSLLDAGDEDWSFEFDAVLRHAYLAVSIGGRILAEGGGGSMAFVASVSGLAGAPNHAPYGSMKAALMALVRSAAVELGPLGIRVNAVAPGVVWTPRMSAFLGDERRTILSAATPLRRVALPEDIASALLFLVSDLSSFISGQTVVVDGGAWANMALPSDSAADAAQARPT